MNQQIMSQVAAIYGPEVTTQNLLEFGNDNGYGNQVYVYVRQNCMKVGRGQYRIDQLADDDMAPAVAPVVKLTRDEMSQIIRDRFDVLETIADGMIAGHIRALMVSGAPGVGKTYILEKKLRQAEASGKIRKMSSCKGTISGIGLYSLLWENREAGQVLVLDDLDKIYGDEEAMNLLKGALDTSETRTISWRKDSSILKENDIPNEFEFEGQVVFITNVDAEAVIEKDGKMAPHMNALLSRSVFLDLAIHSNEQVMIRIEQVMTETNMSQGLGLTTSQTVMILDWMRNNIAKLRSISLRSVIQISQFMQANPGDWQRMASVTMLKKGRMVF